MEEIKSDIEIAKELAERIEAANKETKELLVQAEKLRVQDILGGKSTAGVIPQEKTHQEKIKDGMRDYFKGTSLERAFK